MTTQSFVSNKLSALGIRGKLIGLVVALAPCQASASLSP
jgi:hypothetical protein